MCVIIYLPKNTKISKEELRDAFDYNDDGAGIAWIKNEKVNYSKGYNDFYKFFEEFEEIINDSSIERVIHFRITSVGKTSKSQCHPFLLSNRKEDVGLLDYTGTEPVLFMNGTIFNQKIVTGLNDTASFIINDLYGSSMDFSNSQDLKIIDKLTGAKWAIVETTGVNLVGDFEEDCGVYYSNLNHRWFTSYTYKSFSGDEDYYNYNTYKDYVPESFSDEKSGWDNEEWYADWLEEEYGHDVLDVYLDCLYYDRLTPNQSLNVALNYVLEKEESKELDSKEDEYIISDDDMFYEHYSVADLWGDEDDGDLELLNVDNFKSLADLFPPKDDANEAENEDVIDDTTSKKSYLNNINLPFDSLIDSYSDLITKIKDYMEI